MRQSADEKKAVLLTEQERQNARDLWSEIFYEDSEAFTDYYFREKMKHNVGYGIWKEDELISMLYLTPYEGMLQISAEDDDFLNVPLYYIVGVGTKKEYRHQGCMDILLKQALHDIQKKGQPFTFLMPASPSIYLPYQFRYIYDRPEFLVPETLCAAASAECMRQEDAAAVAAFAEKQLRMQYQLFLHRDEAYYLRQQKESRAQNGDVCLWKENGEIKGFYLYAKEEAVWIQEAVAEKEFAQKKGLVISEKRKPIIMARITDVRTMLCSLRLKENAPFETLRLQLEVSDELLAENNGTFLWTVGKKESTIAMVEGEGTLRISIADLTEFLFARRRAEECFSCVWENALPQEIAQKLSFVNVIASSFLNEIV